MKVYISNGKLNVNINGYEISDFKVFLEYYGTSENYVDIKNLTWNIQDDGKSAKAEADDGGAIQIFFEENKNGLLVWANYLAGKTTVNGVLRLKILGRLPIRATSAVYNHGGWHNGNRCIFSMNTPGITTALLKNQTIVANQFVGLKDEKTQKYVALGAVTFGNYFSTVTVSETGEFVLYAHKNEHLYEFYTKSLSDGDIFKTDKFIIAIEDKDALISYGKAIKDLNKCERRFNMPSGWCSWYYYLENITEDRILENAKVAKEKGLPFDVIQIDEGWEKKHGDWDPNEKFPSGMKAIADKIKELGFIPGLWVAPFFFDTDSETFKNHQDWFIQDSDFVSHRKKYIDFSREGARNWLRDLIKKFTIEWGFRYLKVDLTLDFIALDGYQDKEFNSIKNYREMWKIIRETAPEDTFLLSCSSPIGPTAGLSDGVRTGKDIFENWDMLRECGRQVLKRTHIHEYTYTDPDCIMVRKAEHEDKECRRFCTRNDMEIDSFITFMSVSGGAMMSSDKLSILGEKEIEKIKSLFPLNTTPATPIDLYEREIPSIFRYENTGEYEMYALINWCDVEDDFKINLTEEKYGKEYFSKEQLNCSSAFKFTLKPHESKILYFVKDKKLLDKLGNSIMPQ